MRFQETFIDEDGRERVKHYRPAAYVVDGVQQIFRQCYCNYGFIEVDEIIADLNMFLLVENLVFTRILLQ